MLFIFLIAAYTLMFLGIRFLGISLTKKRWSKRCPHCGHLCATTNCGSNLYWKGTINRPAFFYHCPNCGNKFDNRI